MCICFGNRSNSTSREITNKKRIPSLHLPIEAHWQLPETRNKRKLSLSRMSFKSIQESLTKISRSNTFKGIFQSVHDPKEEQAVEEIRRELLEDGKLPEKFDDYHTLLRFLRMRAFNVAKAKEMFLNMVKWREDFGVDSLIKDFKFEEIERVKKHYPHGFHGVDRYGRPVYIERIGLVDLNSLLKETTVNRFIKYHISQQEKTLGFRFPACSLAAKKHVASTTMVLDVKGVTLNQLFIINAGSGFRALWRVLKAFLEARTLAKIQVPGTSYKSDLYEAIDPSNLPEFLGGTCNCSSSGGCLMKDKGPVTDPEINNLLQEAFVKGKTFGEEINDAGVIRAKKNQQITQRTVTSRHFRLVRSFRLPSLSLGFTYSQVIISLFSASAAQRSPSRSPWMRNELCSMN
ncbi:hypothetical protein LUZ60_002436 [Juncus effusus]|nr:hypothetical protein LUZ60_002436 [Juncus effusus]